MKDGDDATRKSRHLRDERDAKLYGKMRELMTSDRGAPGAKAKVRNALKRVDSEFDQRGPDIALDRQDAEVMGLCRDVVSKEAWKRWSANACEDAVKNDSIERLKFLHECECPWRKNKILYVCAEHGSTECMKYLLKHGCKFGNHACTTAAEFGFLECLKYLREHGHNWDEMTCLFAAKNGHLECLKYAHEQGCPWDAKTCWYAAKYGHLECLKYAHERGCPWDAKTYFCAMSNGNMEVILFLIEREHPHAQSLRLTWEKVAMPILPDADAVIGLEIALSRHRHRHDADGGHVSLREILPFWREHRRLYDEAHRAARVDASLPEIDEERRRVTDAG